MAICPDLETFAGIASAAIGARHVLVFVNGTIFSVRYTQSLEAGEYFPTLPTLVKLRQGLGANWDELFEGC